MTMSSPVADEKAVSHPSAPRTGFEEGEPLFEHRPRWKDLKAAAEQQVRKNPLAAVAVGLAIGVLLGWFIKRR
jgi:ElaB/YqjD/DUF883 family membrane-anchored ribosome-binding protein